MVVKLMNYNILENIFTVIKKLSLRTLCCLTFLSFGAASTVFAETASPAAATPAVAADSSAKDQKSETAPASQSEEKPDTDTGKLETGMAPRPTEGNQELETNKPAATNNVITKGNPEAGKTISTTCVACHGADGNSPLPIYPKLAGQHENYLLKMLLAYQALKDPASESATHKSTNAQIMYTQVMNFSEQELADLAAFFSTQNPSKGETIPTSYELGRKLYLGGDLERGIPACAACHSPAGLGNDLANFPKLSGQHSEYIKAQLLAFKNDERMNDMMQIIAKKLTEEEMAAVSSYASGLH